MEGTSGAAERAPLRGGAREAALSQSGSATAESPGRRGSLRQSTSGSLVREILEGISTTQATPACARHEQRQEVSEPIGLGRSSPRERSRREVPGRGKLTSARPLARDISAGRASKEASPSAAQGRNRKVAITRVAASSGDRGRGHAGFGDPRVCSRVVSIAGSRQAARGPSRPGTKSLWITRMGLALLRESAGGVKERRKPNRRWQNREIGGGFPQNGRVAEAALLGSTCRWKALWVGEAASL